LEEGEKVVQMKGKETLSIDQMLRKIVNMPDDDESSPAEKSSTSALFSEEDERRIIFDIHQAAMVLQINNFHLQFCNVEKKIKK
jgi:hypothetical protein